MFGTFSRVCQSAFSECYTFDEMRSVCSQNGKLTFKPWEMILHEHIIDWKSYLGVDLRVPSFHHITEHHAFQIGKACNGDLQLLYKEWRRDKEWKGCLGESSGVAIFSSQYLQQALDRQPKWIHYSKPVDAAVADTVQKIMRCLQLSETATPCRLAWFGKFLEVPEAPNSLPQQITKLLTPLVPVPEELTAPPIPLQTVPAARPIVAHVLRPDPQLYSNRDPRVGELVVVEMNPDDRIQWPSYVYWVGRVLQCSVGTSRKYHILWYYNSKDGQFHASANQKQNIWKVERSTILFSGFSLTSTNKLYTANEQLFMSHDKVKQHLE